MAATIFDIARLAQTSKSTVSRVISGSGYVKDSTKARVLAAIHELNYVPNQIARDLKYQRTKTIGFLVNTYYPNVGDFINNFAIIAKKFHYQTSIYLVDTEEDELNALNLLVTHQIDAAFMLSKVNDWDKITPYTRFGPIATWRRLDSDKIYSSYVDHYPIYLTAMNYLKDLGIHKIGHVFNDRYNSNTIARVTAIENFQVENPTIEQDWRQFFWTSSGAGEMAAQQWLQATDRPDAVIIYSDYVAADFIKALRAANYRVPEDCKVIGFENDIFGQLFEVTTFDPRIDLQAANSFYYLYNQINHTKLPYETIKPQMIIRQTC
ncbi:LacI family DNA-binding transcriptional regulator [Lapidilactobacillus mulanensis]|uniref:LacI family DNA-binding transcriptional regulator n=1 Tax=Lapidilactobacillus mulanensis TaxID=2485999 RepID=A0ABW4DRG2_9LACO|nr:LacI family DNA-binding transcriptional regulator [Lapidilactobacillus mulanensis]